MAEELTPAQKARLEELKAVIRENQYGWNTMMDAMFEVAHDQLYHPYTNAYDWFKFYFPSVAKRLSKARLYQLLEAEEVRQNLLQSNIVGLELPTNARQLNELAKAPPAQQAEIWQAVVRHTEGKPTARAIAEAVRPTPTPMQSFFGETAAPAPKEAREEEPESDVEILPRTHSVPKKKIGQKWQASFIASTRFDQGNRRLISVTNPYSGRTDKDIIDTYFDEDSGRQTTTDFYAVQKIAGVPVLKDLYQIVLQAIDEGQHLKGLEALKNRIEMEQEQTENE